MAARTTNEPVVIVGSACRFAGDASSPSKLWDLLHKPRDVRSEIPDSRFSAKGFYHPDHAHHGRSNVLHSYLINDDPSLFDAEFFGVRPVEAKAMDPQQRWLMEVVYEGLESAGMPIENLRGSNTGVYVGAMCSDYESLLLRDLQATPTYLATGTGKSILSNRISYFFDWRGPSMTVDTACSSSLVAVHMAVQALRSGESRMALACGSNLILGPENYIIESKLKMLSPDGVCRMWDRDANGYARGDGVAALVLKTLSAALEDGDHIESVIRETGLGQDGATPGITMPSASAQEALIRSTYAKAGLDLGIPENHPQYFEAHGTGTPAGDPIEAEAIHKAFFGSPSGAAAAAAKTDSPLYVGSIKTVLGHTEGTAGVAALMKASLALQNACIPANLLFDNLSDSVAPFYKNLEIATCARPWPSSLVDGSAHMHRPRRASVNSFGFGGTNAHAVLESYEAPRAAEATSQGAEGLVGPFVFSAASEQSLRASLQQYSEYLRLHPAVDPHDLAWTLRERRSAFPFRIAFTASTVKDLLSQILSRLQDDHQKDKVGVRALPAPKILGVFTGQGAQYARMGADLIENFPLAQRIIQDLGSHLARLPGEDRPTWSLEAELLADAGSTRVSEAALSQPLCTAVQILLVDLLRLANVNLDCVVGHSSGEIAAAYAAGFLTARDAMVVAYYRGLHLKRASSPNDKDMAGAMVAVGTSMDDAAQLCEMDEFAGRIAVAASNSSSSVTISGDEDAITELQAILDDENKFNRRLKVDKAYHSKHMLPCFDAYVESLQRSGVQAQKPTGSCVWVSSVYNRPMELDPGLNGTYWAENMTRPVLFSQALSTAVSESPCGVALEVGAHPALKGPATQTLQEVLGAEVPYHGLMSRQTGAVEALSAGLGFLWQHLGGGSLRLDGLERAMTCRGRAVTVVKGLPTYQWTHNVKHWHESRASRKMRLRKEASHSLLGEASADGGAHCRNWRNLLRSSEIDWLAGHQVQGQTVFPAAGYVSTALEAARLLAEGTDIRLLELSDFVIHQAVVFEQDDAGVEVLISLSDIDRSQQDRIQANFTYSASMGSRGDDLVLAASGKVRVLLGDPSPAVLPERAPDAAHMINVDPERFYSSLADLGYNFSGRFRSLSAMRRKHGRSTCMVALEPRTAQDEPLLAHPAELDAAFQSLILAYSYPHDDQLRSLHLPTKIRCIRVNPALCMPENKAHVQLVPVDAALTRDSNSRAHGFSGDINLFNNDGQNAAIQVQAVTLVPLGGRAVDDDREVFSKLEWINRAPDAAAAASDTVVTQHHRDVLVALERISTFYLRDFDRQVPSGHRMRSERPYSCYLHYARHVISLVESGKHRWAKREWLEDSLETVLDATKEFRDIIDVRVMHLVGQTMPRVFRGETTMLEHFRTTGLLDDYYTDGFGLGQSSQWIARTVAQIADRYPHMNMLEIGAGTGGATKNIFKAVGKNFLSYTFTDISAGFFGNAASIFAEQKDQIVFKTFDAERTPVEQGFVEGTYDLIVASFVIHATAELEKTMSNIRRLLRPGGFLVVGEGSHTSDPGCFIFGPLPGWWLGYDEGRTLSPHASPEEWHRILRATGFSGIDTIAPPDFQEILGVSLFVSQAVDERVALLREPLAEPAHTKTRPIERLVLVGGKTSRSAQIVKHTRALLAQYANETHTFETLEDIDHSIADATSTVLSMTDLDAPVFRDMTPTSFTSFRRLFEEEKSILWVTTGRIPDEPWSNLTVGFGRTAVNETPGLRLQHLDIPDVQDARSKTIAETLLRFHYQEEVDQRVLWAAEPEILLDAEGRQFVPRLRALVTPNARYNSAMRRITQETDVTESPVLIKRDGRAIIAEKLSGIDTINLNTGSIVDLQVTHAVLSALKTPLGHHFLAVGREKKTGDRYVVLLSSIVSATKIPVARAVSCQDSPWSDETLLSLAAAHIISMAIVDPLFRGQTIVLHNPTRLVAETVTTQASVKGVQVVVVTDLGNAAPPSWVRLAPHASQTEVFRALPPRISSFVGLSSNGSGVESTILSGLSEHCHQATAKTLFSSSGSETEASSEAVLGQTLERVLDNIRNGDPSRNSSPAPSFTIQQILEAETVLPDIDPMAILDMTSDSLVGAHFSRLDVKPIFKGNQTYWLVGLSGALGISLCDWMIDRGARILVLSSRNPKIDPSWIEGHKQSGVNITIAPCDVTDELALRAVKTVIESTLPPIVGVLNGAMVLRDTSVRNMKYDQLMDVVRPKVLGSIHMDRLFKNDDLDFFILFSSINCLIGNTGQANYAAANTFLCSLAAQRRGRGLAATAINVGAIIGAGYIERESSKALDLTVAKGSLMHLSEDDFHQLFAEAIEAGHPSNPDGPDLYTGVLSVAADAPDPPRWVSDPKFLSFIIHRKSGDAAKKEASDKVTIQDLLHNCRTPQDLQKMIQKSFAAQLRNDLQMNTADDELMAMRSNEIGLDSLISVDIRAWFLKNFQVSIPVLKILSNETMANLVQIALEAIPPELVPNMDSQSAAVGGSSSGVSTPPSLGTMSDSQTQRDSDVTTTETGTPIDEAKEIDWDAETSLTDDLGTLASSREAPSRVQAPPKVIVLTGASGLLGHHLSHYLLQRSSADKIICVGMRQLAQRLRSNELPQNDRVAYYEGDLSQPRLGLSVAEADAIFAEADAVIHNGADTSHLKSYRAVQQTNVASTRELVRLALPRRIPFHYVSSVGAALFSNQSLVQPVSAADGPPPGDGSHGYMASKWACERILERVNKAFGLAVCIHRPSTIIREGEDAESTRARLDWVNCLLQYIGILNTAPRVEHIRGALDLIHVQSVCELLVGQMLKGPRSDGAVSYVHQVGDIVMPLDQLHKIGEKTGRVPGVLPMAEWVSKAVAAGMHPGVAALIEAMDTAGTPDYPRLQRGSS